jgi:hypothetical protein
MTSPGSGGEQRLPRLQSAQFERLDSATEEAEEVEVTYKSGASFKGVVQDHKKSGRGLFSWPNGARYEGQYTDDMRNGKGAYK